MPRRLAMTLISQLARPFRAKVVAQILSISSLISYARSIPSSGAIAIVCGYLTYLVKKSGLASRFYPDWRPDLYVNNLNNQNSTSSFILTPCIFAVDAPS